MIDTFNIQRLQFNLNHIKPIEILTRNHTNINDHYFDMHYEFEIGILVKGKMKRSYLDSNLNLGSGDVWLCNMWEPHGFEIVETPCEVVVFVIAPRYLANCDVLNTNLLSPFLASPLKRPKSNDQNRSDLIALAQKVKSTSKKKNNAEWAKLHFFQLFLLLNESWKAPTTVLNFEQRESIQMALQLIFENRRLISTKEAALACNMSATKFRNLFKSQMKSTFSDFALRYRILGAMSQLNKSKDTQENVATQWGFTDASHLHKYIKESNKEL